MRDFHRWHTPEPSGLIANRRARLIGQHKCNAYCRDGRHGEVFFVLREGDATEEEFFASLFAAIGLRMVACQPAPEVREDEYEWTGDWLDRHGRPIPGHAADDATPWLVIWEDDG